MMSTELAPTNIAVIGTGKHAEWSHIEQLAANPQAHIGMLADIDPNRLEEVQGKHAPDAVTTTNWQETLENPDVKAVFIMTPDRLHTPQALAAINHGKHVFVEKPLANTWDDYELLRNGLLVAKEKGLVVSTCHPRRFDPPFVNTKRLLDDRLLLATTFGLDPNTDFGAVKTFSLDLNYSRPSKTGLHESFASDHMPHEMDTTSHFFGFSGLRRAVSLKNEELEFDIKARREDGIRLRFTGNRLQPVKGYREDWQVGFENGMTLGVNAHSGEISLRRNPRDRNPIRTDPTDSQGPLYKTAYDRRFTDLNQHFVNSVRDSRESPYLTHEDMLMNTVVALALQDVRKPVAISEDGSVRRKHRFAWF